MLRELVEDALAAGGAVTVVDDVDDLKDAIKRHQPDCVLTCDYGEPLANAVRTELQERQHPQFIVLARDAREGWLHELVQQVTPLDNVTPDELRRVVSAASEAT
jgi:hypothetical protein